MKQILCSRCKTRPAVIFVSRIEGDKTTQEGFCIKCAMEMNIGPVKQMLEKMGIEDEDIDELSGQIDDMMDTLEEQGFDPGGASTLPFFNQILGAADTNSSSEKKKKNELAPQPKPERAQGESIMPGGANVDGREREKEKEKKRERRRGKNKDGAKTKRKFLGAYCTDLTQKARDGKIDRIIGREQEIARTTQILCRRTKNNPCFIGEPGVGKTAIAEGLALKIAAGDVPAKLMNKEIHLLDLTALVAGTQFRGQFESRIKGLVDEVKEEGNIILFIDEVHNLVGTGDAEGSMNAANILKPALSRGEIQVIGATTFTEYRKHIEKDAALERRFQPVKVEEPSIAETYEMLKGIKSYYENFHKVQISDSLIYKTVTLSERYITDRFLPDKAIDLLDEACTCANLRNKAISDYDLALEKVGELKSYEEELMQETEAIDYEELSNVRTDLLSLEGNLDALREQASDNAVIEDDIAKVIHLWTGIPVQKIIDSELQQLSDMEEKIKARIIGQDEAVALVCAAIKRSRVRLSPQKRPASFIFAGPTGVGKTELVKQLANQLFDSPETLIRLDMSEFMEKHSVSRIIGSPPGYVGYDEAGQLTEKVRRKPYSVILFDEIEKAHPDVMNILLQILDEGRTNDAQGRTINFENTVIIMTTNAGSERKESAMGFGRDKGEANRDRTMKALRDFLRPEFIGRVDEVVIFHELGLEEYRKIARILIDEFRPALQDKGIELNIGDGVCDKIAREAEGGARGARDIRNVIRRKVEDQIANILVSPHEVPVTTIHVLLTDGEIRVTPEFAS